MHPTGWLGPEHRHLQLLNRLGCGGLTMPVPGPMSMWLRGAGADAVACAMGRDWGRSARCVVAGPSEALEQLAETCGCRCICWCRRMLCWPLCTRLSLHLTLALGYSIDAIGRKGRSGAAARGRRPTGERRWRRARAERLVVALGQRCGLGLARGTSCRGGHRWGLGLGLDRLQSVRGG